MRVGAQSERRTLVLPPPSLGGGGRELASLRGRGKELAYRWTVPRYAAWEKLERWVAGDGAAVGVLVGFEGEISSEGGEGEGGGGDGAGGGAGVGDGGDGAGGVTEAGGVTAAGGDDGDGGVTETGGGIGGVTEAGGAGRVAESDGGGDDDADDDYDWVQVAFVKDGDVVEIVRYGPGGEAGAEDGSDGNECECGSHEHADADADAREERLRGSVANFLGRIVPDGLEMTQEEWGNRVNEVWFSGGGEERGPEGQEEQGEQGERGKEEEREQEEQQGQQGQREQQEGKEEQEKHGGNSSVADG